MEITDLMRHHDALKRVMMAADLNTAAAIASLAGRIALGVVLEEDADLLDALVSARISLGFGGSAQDGG